MCRLFLVRVFRTQTCIFLIRIIIFVVVFYRIELLLNFRGEEAELADNVFYPLCYEGTVQCTRTIFNAFIHCLLESKKLFIFLKAA